MTHSDDIFLYVNSRYISLTQMLAMKKEDIKTLDARGCTGLTAIDAPAAKYLDARGCTGLTAIDAPKAKIEKGHYAFGGCDSRGYIFEGVEIGDQWRVVAGCRNFSIADARLHWGPDGRSNRPDCLALVEKIAADIAQQDAERGKLVEA